MPQGKATSKPEDQGPALDELAQNDDRSAEVSRRFGAVKFAALGTELAGCTLVFTAIGYVIDRGGGHPVFYATAGLTLVGFALGMVRFVMAVQGAAK